MKLVPVFGSIAILGLSACSHPPSDPDVLADYKSINDPAEPTNRTIFAGNMYVDRHVLKPVAVAYTDNMPEGVRRSIHNFTSNLEEPGIVVNDVLQGNFDRAWNTTERFAVNTIVGGIGLFDVASEWDHPHQSADFGQTLGVWGVGPGPAVQLPLLGPSNARDAVGKVAGIVTDPISLVSGGAVTVVKAGSGGLGAVDARGRLVPETDELERTSLDYYAALRSIAAQKRAAMVEDGKAGGLTEHVSVSPATLE
ncbi:MAG: VacJ family lipoprotein [Rhodospirillales bacterium]|nr:VacJ family lipoprotein [Rhodospirillales bacterium]